MEKKKKKRFPWLVINFIAFLVGRTIASLPDSPIGIIATIGIGITFVVGVVILAFKFTD